LYTCLLPSLFTRIQLLTNCGALRTPARAACGVYRMFQTTRAPLGTIKPHDAPVRTRISERAAYLRAINLPPAYAFTLKRCLCWQQAARCRGYLTLLLKRAIAAATMREGMYYTTTLALTTAPRNCDTTRLVPQHRREGARRLSRMPCQPEQSVLSSISV